MTALQHTPPRSPLTLCTAPPRSSAPTATMRALIVCWEISPCAIRTAAPLHPAIASMNGQVEKIARATLEWRIGRDAATAILRLEVGEDDVVIPIIESATVTIVDGGRGLTHVRAGDDLVLVIRDRELVYGWTTVLSVHLGLMGGVYDPPALQ